MQAHAQLVNFSDTTCQWYVADTYPNGSMQDPGFTETTTTTYYYEGDTLIGTNTWSVMMARPLAGSGDVPAFIGCSRSADDLVFFRDITEATDTLYDFSLLPGDSVYYPEPIDAFLNVVLVTSVLIANEPHRVIDFAPFLGQIPSSFEERWIEGVGSIHGPLFPRYPRNFMSEVPGDSLMLTCFERADTLLWSHQDYPDCIVNIILGIEHPQLTDSRANVWPNPGSQEVHVAVDLTGPLTVVFRDLQGRTIQQHGVQGSPARFDTSFLANGIYTVQVIGRSGTLATKLWIKQ